MFEAFIQGHLKRRGHVWYSRFMNRTLGNNWIKAIAVNIIILVCVLICTDLAYETNDDYAIAGRIVFGEVFDKAAPATYHIELHQLRLVLMLPQAAHDNSYFSSIFCRCAAVFWHKKRPVGLPSGNLTSPGISLMRFFLLPRPARQSLLRLFLWAGTMPAPSPPPALPLSATSAFLAVLHTGIRHNRTLHCISS